MDKRADLAVALVVVALAFFTLFESGREIFRTSIVDPVGPTGLARALAVALVVFGLGATISILRRWKAQPGWIVEAEGEEDEPGFPISFTRPFAVFVIAVAYLQLLPLVGFILLTPLFLAAELAMLGVRDWRQLVGIAVGFTI
ncbi:MAG: tripartite tricarboxylate transporter TctB family protein, partial [Chloroflexi bacterium]|nr:tripartite tricarboxylate transporter TctB family protein [Chloroflexota bacterium]